MNSNHSNRDKSNQLEWLLEKRLPSKGLEDDSYEPYYGDVTELNTNRLILDSVGKNTLKQIAEDAIDLLDTSVAIYESNGDYAYGMFSSGWCQLMDTASRKLCNTDDNRIALDCGCWLCHENCWNDSAKASIESGQSTDIQCVGGINLYAEPIYAGKSVVGTINIGYGTPPKDLNRLKDLADTFDIDIQKLKEQADSYNPRPLFLVDLAKKRLKTSASLIGEMVEKSILQKKLQDSKTFLESTNRMAKVGGWELDLKKQKVLWTHMTGRIHELPDDFVPKLDEAINYYHPDDQKKVTEHVSRAIEEGLPYKFEARLITAKGRQRWVRAIGEPMMDGGECVRLSGTFQDITERKEAELELIKSENRYRDLVQSVNSAIIRYQSDGTITYFNEYAQTFFGYSIEEVIGKKIGILLPEKESTGMDLTGLVQDIVDHPHRYTNNINENICNDGRHVWMSWTNKAFKDSNGLVAEILTVGNDITERKKIEESLTKNESLFRGLFDNMTSGSAIYEVLNDGSKGSDYIVKNFNQKSLEIEGKTLDQIVGKSLFDLRPNIDDYGLIPVMKKVWETGEPGYLPIKIYQDKIFSNYYENYIFKIPTGEVVTIYNDVTDQKNSELALKESEKRFVLAMEFANDGIFDWNLETNEIYYSPGWKRMLGYEDEELPNDFSVWEKLTKPEDVARSWKMQTELINRKRNKFEIEFKMQHKDGHWVDILSRANAIFDKNNEAIRIIGIHVDISERKKLESQLLRSQKLESIGNLAGGIAHEFNNILSIIIGNNELVLEDLPKWSLSRESSEEIRLASLRARDIVKHLLTFSRQDNSTNSHALAGTTKHERP